MLGAARDEVRVYAAGGWLSLDIEALCEEAVAMKDGGFPAYKMRAGNADWRGTSSGRAVREALGDKMELMVDVNQALDVPTAIKVARALENSTSRGSRSRSMRTTSPGAPVSPPRWTFRSPRARRSGARTGCSSSSAAPARYTPARSHALRGDHRLPGRVQRRRERADAGHLPPVHADQRPSHGDDVALGFVEYIPGWFDPLFAESPSIEAGHIRLGASTGAGIAFAAAHVSETA